MTPEQMVRQFKARKCHVHKDTSHSCPHCFTEAERQRDANLRREAKRLHAVYLARVAA